ncbi:MAG: methyltransferase [Pseudomonas sp.]
MDLANRFEQLDAWLARYQSVWRAKPFVEPLLGWEAQWPELAEWLRGRTLEQAERAHTQLHSLQAPAPFAELLAEAQQLVELPDWSQLPPTLPEILGRHMPGRKWQQITRFAAVTRQRWQYQPEHWLDWCAGKGHLGRLLAWQTGQPLTCLEYQPALNSEGARLSQHLAVKAEHLDADVLSPAAWTLIAPQHSVVALHACGQLHMTLLQQVVGQQCPQLALSPCCYNRIVGPAYQPLSQHASRARLQLSKEDLALPLQETHTAGQRNRRLRDQSMAWRLAFDLWRREATGSDSYLPTPSRPESALNQGMPAFCRELASYHGLTLPEPADWQELEASGWQRLAQVRNLELVRGLFRRPLEVWLLLDRALFLQEVGYSVELGQFCPVDVSPRNLLLLAERPG